MVPTPEIISLMISINHTFSKEFIGDKVLDGCAEWPQLAKWSATLSPALKMREKETF